MYVIVGLGNPGPQYAFNRHNIGFMMADRLHEVFAFQGFQNKYNGQYTQGKIQGHPCLLVKPLTFMNLSGQCVAGVVQFFKVPLDHVIVFHDELDLEPARIKIKRGGSSGGHNGLNSLDQTIGKNYWRVRMGIGHPGCKNLVSNYVLSNFLKTDATWLSDNFTRLTETIPTFLEDQNASEWMNRLNHY